MWKFAMLLALANFALPAYAGGEMKKVCHTEKVKGKDTEVCKTIKVHKKLEGKQVPQK